MHYHVLNNKMQIGLYRSCQYMSVLYTGQMIKKRNVTNSVYFMLSISLRTSGQMRLNGLKILKTVLGFLTVQYRFVLTELSASIEYDRF